MKRACHVQTLANRTKPGPSLQVEKWSCLCCQLMFLLSKTAQLKVENSAKTTFRFSPVRYRAPRVSLLQGCLKIEQNIIMLGTAEMAIMTS